jgi:hypothetical protein
MALLLGMPFLAIAGTLSGICLCSAGPLRILRRLMLPGVDLMAVFRAAIVRDPGRAWQGLCILIGALALALVSGTAKAAAEPLPPGAVTYLPMLRAEQQAHWPGMPMPSALAAQVEQETCISLRHPRCWSPFAELRTSREQGVGFPQITRAFRADGSLRLDSLAELRAQFPAQLAGWDWGNPSLYDPALQLRALVLMDLRNWQAIVGVGPLLDHDRLAMMLVSYNGGLRGLAADRALCAGTPGCDPDRWAGHVERTCTKSQTAAPGYGRSFCEINRAYPAQVLGPRRGKYVEAMEG